MMNSAIVIALTIACSNGVWANSIPTTVPPTSPPPQVCYVNGITLAVGQTYEDIQPWDGICRYYVCDSPPDGFFLHFACYDVTTDRCVTFYSTQMIDGCERVCEPYTESGRPGWVAQGCGTTPLPTATNPTPPSLPTTQPPLPLPTTTPPPVCPPSVTLPTAPPLPECTWNGVQYTYGEIPNSGGCYCYYTGDVICP